MCRDRLIHIFKVFVIAGGIQGRDIIGRLVEFNGVDLVGLSDQSPESPDVEISKKHKIPSFLEDPVTLIQKHEVDLVCDLSGHAMVGSQLHDISKRFFEVVTGEVT